jgi:lysylphosphatidylglycerol synthetase-like protein (DUF2156 family)
MDFGMKILWFMHFEDVFQRFENECLLFFIFLFVSLFLMKMGEEREQERERERERDEDAAKGRRKGDWET